MEDHSDTLLDSREAYWSLATFLSSLVITGYFFKFNYTETVQVQLHDAYVAVFPIYFALILWVALMFVVFLVGNAKEGFTSLHSMRILVIANTFLLAFCIIGSTMSYRFYKANFATSDLFEQVMVFWSIVIFFLSLCEFLFVKRLKKVSAR